MVERKIHSYVRGALLHAGKNELAAGRTATYNMAMIEEQAGLDTGREMAESMLEISVSLGC